MPPEYGELYLIKAIKRIYQEGELSDEEEQNLSEQEGLDLGNLDEVPSNYVDKFFRYKLRQTSREEVIFKAYNMFRREAHSGIEESRYLFLINVEFFEISALRKDGEYISAVIRGSAFIQNLLDELYPSSNFNNSIDSAFKDNFISLNQRKALELVREVRNDVAHNFWLETELERNFHDFVSLLILVCFDFLKGGLIEDKDWQDPTVFSFPEKTNKFLKRMLIGIEEQGAEYNNNGQNNWNLSDENLTNDFKLEH